MGNLLIVHGGGPTTVLNSSLYGVINKAKQSDKIEKIYGALGGTSGLLEEKFIDFDSIDETKVRKLLKTPGTAIGTSRTPLYEKEYKYMVKILEKYDIKYVIFNGGNGTMDTCGNLSRYAGEHVKVMGIPKTIDNDLSETDHSPGYGSIAKYMAVTTAEISQDVKSMPIHVSIIEAMGRNVGWITAASVLARRKEGDGPHMILLPENPFNETLFLERVKKLYEELGGVVIVASEGLKNSKGEPIVKPIYKTERATYFGDVGSYLAELIIKKLGIKARSEKPGIAGRSSITLQSTIDCEEAIMVGEKAVEAVLEGKTKKMVVIKRISNQPYEVEYDYIDIEKVMMHEKKMPEAFYDANNFDVTQEFIEYCTPLVGKKEIDYIFFNDEKRR